MSLKIKGVSLEIVDIWLHDTEDGQSVINALLKLKYGKKRLRCEITDFKRIDPSVKDNAEYAIITYINKYFETHNYPFKADYIKEEPLYISIKKTRELFHCPVHNIPYKTESDLIAHQKCSFESKTEQEERPTNIVIEDADRETEKQRERMIQEERRAMQGNKTR